MAAWYFSVCVSLLVVVTSQGNQLAEEGLSILHLPDARTVAHFQFTTTWDLHPMTLAQEFKGRLWYLLFVLHDL